MYSPGKVALWADFPVRPNVGLHDLAHWLVADRNGRSRRNFGLGPFPAPGEWRPPAPQYRATDVRFEESLASVVNVMLAHTLLPRGGAQAKAVADFLSLHNTYDNPRCSHKDLWC